MAELGYSKRNWLQELFGGDDPYVDNDDPWTRLSGDYGTSDADLRELAARAFRKKANSEYLNSLSDSELVSLIDPFFEKTSENSVSSWFTGDDYTFNMDAALEALSELKGVPTAPNYEAIQQAAQDAIAAENAEMYGRYDAQEALLDELRDSRTASYESDLQGIRSDYGTARSNLLSQQQQRNSQLMDTLQSQMSKQQRNALEAGASAGIRIAGNINTLLSVQNKQSQQSLETSNQLAQMLLNQRAAERGLRNDYDNYMSQDAANRASIDAGRNQVLTSTQGRVNEKYSSERDVQQSAYDQNLTGWYSSHEDNPFADSYLKKKTNSQYGG